MPATSFHRGAVSVRTIFATAFATRFVPPPTDTGPRGKAEPVPRRAGPRVGRNDPCPCGCGKKFKKHLGAG